MGPPGPQPTPAKTARDPAGRGRGRRTACQFSVYPLGKPDYMATIYQVIDLAKEQGLYGGSPHFCSRLDGRIDDVFDGLAASFALAASRAQHTVMVATLSCNSPSAKRA